MKYGKMYVYNMIRGWYNTYCRKKFTRLQIGQAYIFEAYPEHRFLTYKLCVLLFVEWSGFHDEESKASDGYIFAPVSKQTKHFVI